MVTYFARQPRFGYTAAAVVLALGLAAARAEAGPADGIVVESVGEGTAAKAAGILPGDVLLAWERPGTDPGHGDVAHGGPARGELVTPLDLILVEREQAARWPITVKGRRGDQPIRFALAVMGYRWDIAARPALAGEALATYERGRKLLMEGGDAREGARLWRAVAASAEEYGNPRTACWLLLRLGQLLTRPHKAWAEAHDAYDAAAKVAREPFEQVLVQTGHGWAFEAAGEFEKQAAAFRAAFELQQAVAPDGLMSALILNEIGKSFTSRGDPAGAEKSFRDALALRERLAPDSVLVAIGLNNLANTLADAGDHPAAQAAYEKALVIAERVAPNEQITWECLNNLGIQARIRGGYAQAEDYLRRALALRERAGAAESLSNVNILFNLGRVWQDQGDLDRAQQLFERSLAMAERVAPAAPSRGRCLNALGMIAERRGDPEAAERHYRLALAQARKLNEQGLDVVHAQNSLALLQLTRGEVEEADRLARQAMATLTAIAPRNVAMSNALEIAGHVALARGDLGVAEEAYGRALVMRRQVAPGSADEAAAIIHIAKVARRKGELEKASALYHEALDVLDQQSSKVGGSSEAQLAFARDVGDSYREAMALLLERDQRAEAFHVLERSRARSFLAMLGDRDLVDADIPPQLDQRRRRVDAEYDRTQSRLERLDPDKEAVEVARIETRLRELRADQAAIRAELRRVSPRFAALRSPQALDAAAARAALDPGTALLSYAVGEDHTDLFVLSTDGADVRVFRIALGRDALADRVRGFRERIQRPRAWETPALEAAAAELYDTLLRPAEEAFVRAQRLLICPDGPLHTLPFAALRRDGRYLVEWKPLHTAVSATVYAELRKDRRPSVTDGYPVVAFADPRYPASGGPARPASAEPDGPHDVTLRAGLRRGLDLAPLPASRTEARSIARLYGKGARLYTGDAATEERAKSEARHARYVHFACHGFLDEALPLNSGLALTIPEKPAEGQDNGLLQAWEVFERLRVDADLVTLSSCNSGLGREMGGEGLIGLTRAFQYAGARSVLASLWGVSDEATADLMRRFYEGLRRGLPKDEALREAQLVFIRAGHARAQPLRWAAFQVFGDWK